MNEKRSKMVLTPEQIRRRNQRNYAIAGALIALVVIFFVITMVRGPMVLVRGS